MLTRCGRGGNNSPEILLFAEIGPQPFSDSIVTVDWNGSQSTLLKPHRAHSYVFAATNSLSSLAAVTFHEELEAGIQDRLYIGSFAQGGWKRLMTMEGGEAEAAISPDNLRVVFTHRSAQKGAAYALWSFEQPNGIFRQLTTHNAAMEWDSAPAWNPNGNNFLFIRFRRDQRLSATLMDFNLRSGLATPVLSSGENVAAATFLRDGAIAFVSSKGLELLKAGMRSILVPWSALPNRVFQGGGIAASRATDRIVVPVFNTIKNQYELIVIDNTAHIQTIYTTPNRISGLSIISR